MNLLLVGNQIRSSSSCQVFVDFPFESHVDVSLHARGDHEEDYPCITYGSLVQLVHL
jgi:hypothetical protein